MYCKLWCGDIVCEGWTLDCISRSDSATFWCPPDLCRCFFLLQIILGCLHSVKQHLKSDGTGFWLYRISRVNLKYFYYSACSLGHSQMLLMSTSFCKSKYSHCSYSCSICQTFLLDNTVLSVGNSFTVCFTYSSMGAILLASLLILRGTSRFKPRMFYSHMQKTIINWHWIVKGWLAFAFAIWYCFFSERQLSVLWCQSANVLRWHMGFCRGSDQ